MGLAASRLFMLNGDGAFATVALFSSGFGCKVSVVVVTSVVALLLLLVLLALGFLGFLDGEDDDSAVLELFNLRSVDDDDDDGSKDGVCSFGLLFVSDCEGALLSVFESLSNSLFSSCDCFYEWTNKNKHNLLSNGSR